MRRALMPSAAGTTMQALALRLVGGTKMLRGFPERARAAASEAASMIREIERDWYLARSVGVFVAGLGLTLAAEYLLMLSDYQLMGIVPLRNALARPVVTIALVTAWAFASWGWERI